MLKHFVTPECEATFANMAEIFLLSEVERFWLEATGLGFVPSEELIEFFRTEQRRSSGGDSDGIRILV